MTGNDKERVKEERAEQFENVLIRDKFQDII